jgi:branched-chain amino acid transport system ATP-binding protein
MRNQESLITEKPGPVEKADHAQVKGSSAPRADELRLEGIHAGYGKKEVLRGVSVHALRGEMIAVVGPNGSGKSTLLKVIAGFLAPASGRVCFDGQEITPLEPHRRVRLGIAYLMQGGRTFPNLTVRENLDVGAVTLRPETRAENIALALDLFPNLRNLINRRAGLLSGGERQALALAMLLIRRPRLLLLDEPSAGLSPKLARDMLGKVRELSDMLGATVLLVEQNIQEALSISERALALVNGSLALETERPAEWLTSGELEQLFLGHKQGAV